MNSNYNTNNTMLMGNNIDELTLFQLQQRAQQLLQQNTLLATQLQLTRSQSMYNHYPTAAASVQQPLQQQQHKPVAAHRSLSNEIYYNHHQQQPSQSSHNVQQQRCPAPGLSMPSYQQQKQQQKPTTTQQHQQQSVQQLLAQLPQTPCIALKRRDSVLSDSDSSLQNQQQEAGRYKTEMCRPFEETGHCRYGAKCQFAHGMNEMRGLNRHPRYKTEFCRTFHTTGFCSYGQRCNFIHNEDERRGSAAPPTTTTAQSSTQQHMRPQQLHMPLTVTNSTGSTGSSPASSVYGGDLSPLSQHSPSYLSSHEDLFSSSTSARLSPAPSISSFTSDYSSCGSFPSPPGTPLLGRHSAAVDNHHCDYNSELNTLSSALEMGLSLSLFNSY